MWLVGFAFGWFICRDLPGDGSSLGALIGAGFVSMAAAVPMAGCRVLLAWLLAPLSALALSVLLWPLKMLPDGLIRAAQPAVMSICFLQFVMFLVPGRMSLFALLGLLGISVGTSWFCAVAWQPAAPLWERLLGCAVALGYAGVLGLLLAMLKSWEARRGRKTEASSPAEPTTAARSLRTLAGRLRNTEFDRLASEVIEPCALAYGKRGGDPTVLDRLDNWPCTDGTLRLFLDALRREMVTLLAGGDTAIAWEARETVTRQLLWGRNL